MGIKISIEQGLNNLVKYFNELGRIPNRRDFKNNKWQPNYDWYAKYFDGKFINACYQANLCEKPLTEIERVEISINELIKLANKLNKCPTVEEYERIKHKGYQRRNLEDKLNIKYNIICNIYLPNYTLNHNLDKTKDDIIKSINNMYEEYGYILPYEEYSKLNNSCSYNLFKKFFDKTYGEVVESLGYKMFGITTIIRTEEELLNDFYNLFIKLKRIPYFIDIDGEDNIASSKTYVKYFKKIENICNLLNIDYKLHYRKSGAGKICYDKNGGLCKSIPEKDISNFFIDKNIYFEKENRYKDEIDNDITRRRFDFKIKYKNKWYYIEYFGMYNYKSSEKISDKYLHKTKRKIKDLYKYGLINQCIFIFPKDIKCNKNERFQDKMESFLLEKYNIFIND